MVNSPNTWWYDGHLSQYMVNSFQFHCGISNSNLSVAGIKDIASEMQLSAFVCKIVLNCLKSSTIRIMLAQYHMN